MHGGAGVLRFQLMVGPGALVHHEAEQYAGRVTWQRRLLTWW